MSMRIKPFYTLLGRNMGASTYRYCQEGGYVSVTLQDGSGYILELSENQNGEPEVVLYHQARDGREARVYSQKVAD